MEQFITEWANVLVFIPIAAVWTYMFKKTIDTYTKKESREQIILRTTPMKELLDRNTAAIESLQVSTALAHKETHTTLIDIAKELATMRTLREANQGRLVNENTEL